MAVGHHVLMVVAERGLLLAPSQGLILSFLTPPLAIASSRM